MRKLILSLAMMGGAMCAAQSDNSFHAKSYPGPTIGQMVSQAMLDCSPNTSIPCAIILDATLAGYGVGTMPTLCAQCQLIDYRNGPPWSLPTTPAWLEYLGNGSDGANVAASGNLSGVKYYTNFSVLYGSTLTVNTPYGLTIHATGTCTITGTINARGVDGGYYQGAGGGSSGGSGGGAAAGTAGQSSVITHNGYSAAVGGSLGSISGGNGGAGSTPASYIQRAIISTGGGVDMLIYGGGQGRTGGSSGGAGGYGGGQVTLICGQIIGTDGTHTGVIDVSGQQGLPPVGNSTGAGSGGGGGVAILSSQAAGATWPSVYFAGGPGGAAPSVPQALATSGTCTSPPKATLTVSAGALTASCTPTQAGAGCGTGAGITWQIVGGGGTPGTATVNPTWSSGALASCTVTPGTSSGYTGATYTTAGSGGDGAPGWAAYFQGW